MSLLASTVFDKSSVHPEITGRCVWQGFPSASIDARAVSRRRLPRVYLGCPVSPAHGTDQSRLGPHDQIAFCGFSGPKDLQDE